MMKKSEVIDLGSLMRYVFELEKRVAKLEAKGKPANDPITFPEQPIAKNLGELVSAKQLGMIRGLARELRIDADIECNAVMGCPANELSKSAASSFIKFLQHMQNPPA